MTLTEFNVSILKQEIKMIDSKINHFDNMRLRIKQFAIALWTAAVGFGLTEKNALLLIIATLLPISFWIIDTTYRGYYEGWRHRLLAIREFIRDGSYKVKSQNKATLAEFLEGNEIHKFPVFDYWAKETITTEKHKRITSFWKNFFYKNSVLVYLPLIVISCILAFLFWFKYLPL